jgi:hypothetical protein
MSIETIALISILTLQTISLGTDFFWLIILRPACQMINHTPFLLDILVNISIQSAKVLPVAYLLILISAIVLNFIVHSRTEVYLLKIGLVSLIIYLSLAFISFLPILSALVPIVNQSKLEFFIQQSQAQSSVFIGVQLIILLVSYWSFLHYALNPKIESS